MKNEVKLKKIESEIEKKEAEIKSLKKEIAALKANYDSLVVEELKAVSTKNGSSIIEILNTLNGNTKTSSDIGNER